MIEEDTNGYPTLDEAFSVFKVAYAADLALRQGKILKLDEKTQEIL